MAHNHTFPPARIKDGLRALESQGHRVIAAAADDDGTLDVECLGPRDEGGEALSIAALTSMYAPPAKKKAAKASATLESD